MNIKELRKLSGMSQSQFAEYFQIPVRTLQKWERGGSSPPKYIVRMIKLLLISNNLINKDEV